MPEFVHMELNTTDTTGAKTFYRKVFGWKHEDMTMPNGQVYSMLAGADGPFGGLMQHPMPGAPSIWIGYVGVKSLASTVAKVLEAGGQVVVQDVVPGMGTFAVFVDPQGATVAAWEAVPALAAKKGGKGAGGKKKAAKKGAKKAAKKGGKKAAKKKAKKRR
jgi:hypothetical protein